MQTITIKMENRSNPVLPTSLLRKGFLSTVVLALLLVFATQAPAQKIVTLLNASYDPTRELYEEFNAAFARYWQSKTGERVAVKQSHGGSSSQARAVIDGLGADVVTLALGFDVDAIAAVNLTAKNWQSRLPNNSAPYTSTIVFLVRKGNPKKIKDWDDLVRPGIIVVPGNPKTSGGARWTYLAAYGQALRKNNGNEAKAREYVIKFYKNAPVLDAGARATTTTFVQRGIGDALVSWENEAYLALQEEKDQFEMVVPSSSILAEPTVAVVDRNANKHGTLAVAQAYLEYLYAPEGQEIVAKHYYRPRDPKVAAKYASHFGKVQLFTIEESFGGWQKAQKTHFADGGVFDKIYQPR
jgi:sulfate transport system substrate-binding protein